MKKVLGITLAMLFALPLAASADQATGNVQAVDRAEQAFVLGDGTKLWLSDGRVTEIREGDQVTATYEMKGDKKIVTQIHRRNELVEGD